ncbi:MAG: SEC-C metal-binding domain-containing protein [Rhodothermales bacterium]
MNAGRNEPCPCGSGKKHKHCCAGKTPWYKEAKWTGALVALVLLGGLFLAGIAFTDAGDDDSDGSAVPGRVWSEEHQHWHDAP